MSVATPEWLARHGAELRGNPDGRSWAVYFGDTLEYVLQVVPVSGKYGCTVKQAITGRHLESGGAQPTPDAALHAGLDDLRRALGW